MTDTGKKKPAAKTAAKSKSAAPKKAAAPKKDETAENAGANAPSDSVNMPMFYKNVTVLRKDMHDGLKLQAAKDHSFAMEANSIVLAASEFAQAAMHYPIVFGRMGNDLLAFAVTGHTGGKNAFIGKDKKWRPDVYVPAYVRRYPFLLVSSEDGKQMSLAVDETSTMINKKSGNPIYENGEPGDVAKRALQFCVTYRRELERTVGLLKQIDETGILVERSAEVTLPDGTTQRVVGFSIVDEQKLSELDDEKFLALRKSGLLNLIYCHLWSMRVWNNLLD